MACWRHHSELQRGELASGDEERVGAGVEQAAHTLLVPAGHGAAQRRLAQLIARVDEAAAQVLVRVRAKARARVRVWVWVRVS